MMNIWPYCEMNRSQPGNYLRLLLGTRSPAVLQRSLHYMQVYAKLYVYEEIGTWKNYAISDVLRQTYQMFYLIDILDESERVGKTTKSGRAQHVNCRSEESANKKTRTTIGPQRVEDYTGTKST